MDIKCKHIISKHLKFLMERIDLLRIKDFVEKRKIFSKCMLEDIYNSNDGSELFFNLLFTRGPYAFSKFIHVLLAAGYEVEANRLQNEFSIDHEPIEYTMTSKPIGFCLIIINEKFDSPLEPRIGSNIDATALESLFTNLGYLVFIEWNLEDYQMLDSIKRFSQIPEFDVVDSSIVFIASHGHRNKNCDYLCDIHNRPVYTTEIFTMFTNINCKRLARKPKMFFFQACRGAKEDPGYYASIETSCDASEKGDATTGNSDRTIVCYPTMTDMFVAHSTLPDYKSTRDHNEGSWFCQDIVDVFSVDYLRHDLETMLESVCRRMERRKSEVCTKQTIHVELYGVNGKVWFNKKT